MNKEAQHTTGKRLAPVLIAAAVFVSFGAFAGSTGLERATAPETLSTQSVMDKKAGNELELMIFIHRSDAGIQGVVK